MLEFEDHQALHRDNLKATIIERTVNEYKQTFVNLHAGIERLRLESIATAPFDDFFSERRGLETYDRVYYPHLSTTFPISNLLIPPQEVPPLETLSTLLVTAFPQIEPVDVISISYQHAASKNDQKDYHAFEISWQPERLYEAATLHIEPNMQTIMNPLDGEKKPNGLPIYTPADLFQAFSFRDKKNMPIRSDYIKDSELMDHEAERVDDVVGFLLGIDQRTQMQWMVEMTKALDANLYH